MPRKTNTRPGKIIPDDAPFLLFGKNGNLTKNIEQAFDHKLRDFLDTQNQDKINYCKRRVQYIINLYFQRRLQDSSISRSERNEALRSFMKTNSDSISKSLRDLDYEAEAALFDAISINLNELRKIEFNVDNEYELIEKIKSKDPDLDYAQVKIFLDDSISSHLPYLYAEKGPKSNDALALALDEVMLVYRGLTGKNPTHSVLKDALEQELPQSPAGKFTTAIVDIINILLGENHPHIIRPNTIKDQVRDAVRRFKKGKQLMPSK